MTKRTREGMAALCVGVALLLIGTVGEVQSATVLGLVAAVLALGAIAVDLARR